MHSVILFKLTENQDGGEVLYALYTCNYRHPMEASVSSGIFSVILSGKAVPDCDIGAFMVRRLIILIDGTFP